MIRKIYLNFWKIIDSKFWGPCALVAAALTGQYPVSPLHLTCKLSVGQEVSSTQTEPLKYLFLAHSFPHRVELFCINRIIRYLLNKAFHTLNSITAVSFFLVTCYNHSHLREREREASKTEHKEKKKNSLSITYKDVCPSMHSDD